MAAGILGKKEIEHLLNSNQLVLNGDKSRIRGASYDMIVGTVFNNGEVVRLHEVKGRQITVPAGGIISLFTAEELHLPDDIVASAFAINAMSSQGFLVLNPGHVDPGYRGPLTVKALNLRKTPLVLQPGEPVFTVVFERLLSPTDSYRGNKLREVKEREFNKTDIEYSPRSLAQAYEATDGGVFPTISQVKDVVRDHLLSRITLGLSVVAAIASVVAAFAAIATMWSSFHPYSLAVSQQTSGTLEEVAADSTKIRPVATPAHRSEPRPTTESKDSAAPKRP